MEKHLGDQDNGGSDTVDETRRHRRVLAGKMETNWWRFKQERGQDERDWEKLEKEELEKMHKEIAGWIQECQDEMRVHPLPMLKSDIADDWSNSLTYQNELIKALIDRKS